MPDANHVLELADRCVKCGLCLPHCPTYGARRLESESPRGRIALLQGVAGGQLVADATLRRHLDDCLGCRSCERVCPAGVEFERLLDAGRRLPDLRRGGWRRRQALRLLGAPRLLRGLHAGIGLLQASGLLALLRGSGLLRLLRLQAATDLLPPRRRTPAATGKAAPGNRGRVALFAGCLGGTLERETVAGARRVLAAFGFEVTVIDSGCCGALAWHDGETAIAVEQATRLITATAGAYDAFLYLATGCGSHLQRYDALPLPESAQRKAAGRLAERAGEITAFLARQPFPTARFRTDAPPLKVAVHMPCSQLNGLRQPDTAGALLGRLPGLQVVSLPDNDRCCGAGATAMVAPSPVATQLRGDKLTAVARVAPDVVASTNPGCAIFLNAGLGHQRPPVVHPVVIMAERLRDGG